MQSSEISTLSVWGEDSCDDGELRRLPTSTQKLIEWLCCIDHFFWMPLLHRSPVFEWLYAALFAVDMCVNLLKSRVSTNYHVFLHFLGNVPYRSRSSAPNCSLRKRWPRDSAFLCRDPAKFQKSQRSMAFTCFSRGNNASDRVCLSRALRNSWNEFRICQLSWTNRGVAGERQTR
jgi:hypothetical protein